MKNSINDIKFHKYCSQCIGLVQNTSFMLMDQRQGLSKSCLNFEVNEAETFSLDFSWDQEFLLLTGSGDGKVKLWDMRNTVEELFLFQESGSPVLKVEWNQKKEGVFGVGGEDNLLKIYDCSRISSRSGLIFIHPGCEGVINDFNWNPYVDLGMIAVDGSNQFQAFEIDEKFYYD